MWIHYNPNPTGRSVDDCAIRAVSKALNMEWEDTYIEICSNGLAMGDMPHADSPKIEKYRLVKEEPEEVANLPEDGKNNSKEINATLDELIGEIEAIKADIKAIKEKLKSITKPMAKKVSKDEDDDDE